MAVHTVSSYSVIQTTLNDVSKVESDLSNEQTQLSSGMKSRDFAGMSGDTQQFLSLDGEISKAGQYLSDNQIVEARINTTSQVLDQVISLGNSLAGLISQRRTGVSAAGFDQQVQGIWQQMASSLNTTLGGQYLFSGTKTNTEPVDANTFPTLQVDGTP